MLFLKFFIIKRYFGLKFLKLIFWIFTYYKLCGYLFLTNINDNEIFKYESFWRFFVIAIAIVASYLVLSLPFSIVTIVRPLAVAPRLILLISDTVISPFVYIYSYILRVYLIISFDSFG